MTKKRASTTTDNAATQGEKPSYGKPPKEHQFKPGQSGNPNGPPKGRTHLWTYYTRYMAMTDAELAKLDRKKLTAAQQTALNLVRNAQAGEGCGAEKMARYCIDREEGKAVEHLIIGGEDDLTDDECEQVRKLIQGNHRGDHVHGRNADK